MLLLRDVTEVQQLQEERHRVKMLKMINAMVSHDLMAPLTLIHKFADQLHNLFYLDDSSEQVDKYHSLIVDLSNFVICRMRDLLVQGLIEHESFVPRESEFSPIKIVTSLKEVIQNALGKSDVKIVMKDKFAED